MDAPPEAKAKLATVLKVTRVQEYGPAGIRVDRGCGSYGITATYFVEDTIAEILEKAKTIEQEMKVKFKWLVAGCYTKIDHIILDPAKFSRGVLKVEVDGDLLMEAGGFEPGISFIFDYKRKLYAVKEEAIDG